MHLTQFSKGICIQSRIDPAYGCIKNTKSIEIIVRMSNNGLSFELLIVVETFFRPGFIKKLKRQNIENEKGIPRKNINISLRRFETNQKIDRLIIEKTMDTTV
jgi:hypothetical protein